MPEATATLQSPDSSTFSITGSLRTHSNSNFAFLLVYRYHMSDEMPRVLSLLSHELRGPLGVVRGYLRLIDQTATELSDRSRQSIAAALRASDRMADVL